MHLILASIAALALLGGATTGTESRSLDRAHFLLGGTRWRLVEFQSMDDATGTVRPDDPALYTMELRLDGGLAMRLNCNRAAGTWSATASKDGPGGQFEFGSLLMTRALCPPPSLDESIAAHAEFVRSYLLADGRLHLSLMADGGIYVWEPDLPVASPEDGGPRNWVVPDYTPAVDYREELSSTAPVRGQFAPGTLLDNLGCREADGLLWCDVQPLGGGARGFVRADRLAPAMSPDGTIATGIDESALRAGRGDFDATGRLDCTVSGVPESGRCAYGVSRSGGGYATVVVTRPDGRTRALFFRMGRPIGADTAEADGNHEFSSTREAGGHVIRVGEERYRIPDSIVLGDR